MTKDEVRAMDHVKTWEQWLSSGADPVVQILMRETDDVDEEEIAAAKANFRYCTSRSDILPGLVIPRYASLPFHAELEADAKNLGAALINTTKHHDFVADITQWAPLLGELTPKTWSEGWDRLPEGQYIVKGRTNSRKHEWAHRMFAPTKADMRQICQSLLDDALIAEQGLVVRKFVPLKTFMVGMNGLPITNEWRFFCLDQEVLAFGYYWASEPDCKPYDIPPLRASELVCDVLARISGQIRFVVVDVAETADGRWICIELNDGTCSGTSLVDPETLYGNLRRALAEVK